MPGHVVAMAHWRRLDRPGTDRCTLDRAEHGWLLSGQATWQEDGRDSALVYTVRCDPDWVTLSADITGEHAGGPVALRIASGPDGWRLNDVPQPGLEGCVDLDLCFTPATNLLPLRRLTAPAPLRAAWLVPTLDRLAPLEQSYTPCEDGAIAYASPNFQARLEVHPSGFVIHYPGLWDGWVDG